VSFVQERVGKDGRIFRCVKPQGGILVEGHLPLAAWMR